MQADTQCTQHPYIGYIPNRRGFAQSGKRAAFFPVTLEQIKQYTSLVNRSMIIPVLYTHTLNNFWITYKIYIFPLRIIITGRSSVCTKVYV